MKALVLLIVSAWFVVACGSPAVNNIAKTNVNAVNSMPYLQTENAYTFAQNSELARDLTPSGTKEAREIVGKTVGESKLWRNKVFNTQIRKLMGADYETMKKSWNTETPIRKFGDFLMMTGCEQQNCSKNQYAIFMDVGAGGINVIHIGRDGIREWNGYERMKLPPPFAEQLAAMKSRMEQENGN